MNSRGNDILAGLLAVATLENKTLTERVYHLEILLESSKAENEQLYNLIDENKAENKKVQEHHVGFNQQNGGAHD